MVVEEREKELLSGVSEVFNTKCIHGGKKGIEQGGRCNGDTEGVFH